MDFKKLLQETLDEIKKASPEELIAYLRDEDIEYITDKEPDG